MSTPADVSDRQPTPTTAQPPDSVDRDEPLPGERTERFVGAWGALQRAATVKLPAGIARSRAARQRMRRA